MLQGLQSHGPSPQPSCPVFTSARLFHKGINVYFDMALV